MIQAALLHFTLEETQWEEDWSSLLSLASQPGSSLEQLHIFALAHILRRPIIVYGVKYVKSFRGEDIGYARFEGSITFRFDSLPFTQQKLLFYLGVYLPLLWEQSFCIKSPIALGYTRGHFSALVPTEPYSRIDAARVESEDVTFLPLMDCEHKLLPIHFLNQSEVRHDDVMMSERQPQNFENFVSDGMRRGYDATMVRCLYDRGWLIGGPTKTAQASVAGKFFIFFIFITAGQNGLMWVG